MPTNVSPEYKKAEQSFRAARDEKERLDCLREMLRTIPKHKGTEHLQADIKSRIKALSDELSGPRKGGKRSGPVHSIRPEGAAQVAMLGPPNSGKSSLHAKLTGSRAQIGPYPHTTHELMAGMIPFADISFQLIDMPAVSADFVAPWIQTALTPADAALLVVDLSDPAAPEAVGLVRELLEQKNVTLTAEWPVSAAAVSEDEDLFRVRLPTLLVGNKSDLASDPGELGALLELAGVDFPAVAVSAETGAGLEQIGTFLFEHLAIVRVYTKMPGKPAETDKPFTVRKGATVHDVAALVHRDIAGSLRYARAWGDAVYDGQQVGPEHPVADGDIVELHMR
ncbi:MAG: TGS domain-containing protein [Gammaproteobacteria bacterium]|jgi:ribosome-interacting GTPase 1